MGQVLLGIQGDAKPSDRMAVEVFAVSLSAMLQAAWKTDDGEKLVSEYRDMRGGVATIRIASATFDDDHENGEPFDPMFAETQIREVCEPLVALFNRGRAIKLALTVALSSGVECSEVAA